MLYIAYEKDDIDFVETLVRQLQEADIPFWADESRLQGRNTWTEEAQQKLTQAYAVLVVYSPASAASQHVSFEWATAYHHKIPLMAVMARTCTIHSIFRSFRGYNFTKSADWPMLMADIKEVMATSKAARDAETPAEAIPETAGFSARLPRELANLVKSPEASDRVTGIHHIKTRLSQDPSLITVLGKVLYREDDAGVRQTAIEVLQKRRLSRTFIEHMAKMNAPDTQTRFESLDKIMRENNPHAVFIFMELLTDEKADIDLAKAALRGLGQFRSVFAIRGLIEVVKKGHPKLVFPATALLGSMGQGAVAPLEQALKDSQVGYEARGRLVRVLGMLRSTGSIRILLHELKDANDRYTLSVAMSLKQLGPDVLTHMVDTMNRTLDMDERRGIIRALGHIQDVRAIRPLLDILPAVDGTTETLILSVLAGYGEKGLPHVIEALKDRNLKIRNTAADVMRHMGFDPFSYGYRKTEV